MKTRFLCRLIGVGLVGSGIILECPKAECQTPPDAVHQQPYLPAAAQDSAKDLDLAAPAQGSKQRVTFSLDPALMQQLTAIGEALANAKSPVEIVQYNLQQADLFSRIAAGAKPEERIVWIRQMADCLIAAALNSPTNNHTAYQRLMQLEKSLQQTYPSSPLTAYVAYREIQAAQLQPAEKDRWQVRLASFVQDYPNAEDTPNALLELGNTSELLGKISDARKWYEQCVRTFPEAPLTLKIEGALRRLDLEGKPLHLALPLLFTENEKVDEPFDIEKLRGKVVVTYFWSGAHQRCVSDFAQMSALLERYRSRGVELLCVNLDNSPDEARAFLRDCPAPGTHVFQRGGLKGIVAQRFGIMFVPHLMLVGPDATVLHQNLEIGKLELELQKQFHEQPAVVQQQK